MNHTEAAALCRMVQAVCPQQRLDELTPDAWGAVLHDVRHADAEAALVELARKQPFVSPAEIIAEVRRLRARRLEQAGPLIPPPDLGEDELAYRRWLADTRRAIADGEPAPIGQMHGRRRDMRAIEGTFRTVDDR